MQTLGCKKKKISPTIRTHSQEARGLLQKAQDTEKTHEMWNILRYNKTQDSAQLRPECDCQWVNLLKVSKSAENPANANPQLSTYRASLRNSNKSGETSPGRALFSCSSRWRQISDLRCWIKWARKTGTRSRIKQLVYFGFDGTECLSVNIHKTRSLTELLCFRRRRAVIRMAKLISPCISLIPGGNMCERFGGGGGERSSANTKQLCVCGRVWCWRIGPRAAPTLASNQCGQ